MHQTLPILLVVNLVLAAIVFYWLYIKKHKGALPWSLAVVIAGPLACLALIVVHTLGLNGLSQDGKELSELPKPQVSRAVLSSFQVELFPIEELAGPFLPASQQPSARMLIASDYSFKKLSKDLQHLGYNMDIPEDPKEMPEEPLTARWVDERHNILYHYVPELPLRRLEITGPSPDYVRNDILNICYTPTLEVYHFATVQFSGDTQALFQALAAASFLCQPGDNHGMLHNLVATLTQDPNPAIATAAKATQARIA